MLRNLMAVVTLGMCVWGLVASLRTGSAVTADRARRISPLEKTV